MRYGEPTAALRRIPVYLVDDAGDPVTGAAPSGSELRVSLSGAAWADADGTWAEIGLGAYYYEATLAETQTGSFLLLRVAAAGARVFVYAVDIGDRIALEAADDERRVPVYLTDSAGDPVDGLELAGAELQVSLAGAAWATGAGTADEIGDGAYYYELAESELVAGVGMLRVSDAGAEVYVYTWDVRPTEVTEDIEPTEPLEAATDETGGLAEIDHITAALRRLPSQYRGSV